MFKKDLRDVINNYGYRWSLLKHNRSSDDKVITVHDAAIIKMLAAGSTLALDCIGYQYLDIIPRLSVDTAGVYNNILAMNALRFRYQTLDEIKNQIVDMSSQCENIMVVGFNFQFVKFNRLKHDFVLVLDDWKVQLGKHGLRVRRDFTKKLSGTNPYGNCLFVIEKRTAS
jgi:hypothetical protein